MIFHLLSNFAPVWHSPTPDDIINLQRNLVIHFFGHALGMEDDECKRSDFWEHFTYMEKMSIQDSTSKREGEKVLFHSNWIKRVDMLYGYAGVLLVFFWQPYTFGRLGKTSIVHCILEN